MFEVWKALSFETEIWFAIAFTLAVLHLLTDEFFFGGACLGALATATALYFVEPVVWDRLMINWSLPYVFCGIAGLIGSTVARRNCRKHQAEPDINEEPYEGENS